MSNQLPPNDQPQVGKYLRAPEAFQRPQLPQASLDLLIAGLRLAEASLDYVEIHGHFKSTEQIPQPFNMFTPKFPSKSFTAYLDGIESEARRTASEFNLIMSYIGGLPVKVALSSPEDIINGSITSLKDYRNGAWVYNFTNQQHEGGVDLRGDTNMLQSWHSAALFSSEQLDTE